MNPALAARIGAALGTELTEIHALAGGDINSAAAVTTGDGRRLFVKWHRAAPPGMFAAEADGLAWLSAPVAQAVPGALRVPAVIAVGDDFLVLEWLDADAGGGAGAGARARDFDERLGRGLAALHRVGAPGFGHARDNFIAILPQSNRASATWIDFWIDRRIAPMIELAIARGRGPARWRDAVEPLRADLPAADEPPARLHGDLWNGNVCADRGLPALIDPAVYGGHREVDLAMLALFGGLSDATARAYHEVHPLAPGWRDRLALWQLYPLLVHTVLFGGGYASSVDAALRRHA